MTMTTISYQGAVYGCREGETVLEALMRQGVNLPFSCRSGICQTCLQRCTRGKVPERAQTGLRDRLRAGGYFMPCRCIPTADMIIEPPRADDLYAPAIVQAKDQVAPPVMRVLLEPGVPFSYHPGQFVNLRRYDGLARSYSLAGLPDDYFLELHVQRKQNGAMSNWIFDTLKAGDEIELQGPQGECFYRDDDPEQPMLLIGTGTGLAPLVGIARAALAAGHRGEIYLYHGTHAASGLYLRDAIEALAARHANLLYRPCVSGVEPPGAFLAGRAHAIALRSHFHLDGWRVYLCGLPQMVHEVHAAVLARGALPEHIHADPFELKDLRHEPRPLIRSVPVPSRAPRPAATTPTGTVADADMWSALRGGELLHEILADFYTRVYADPRLSPYFARVTKQRLIEKQFLFLRQHFTGEKVYFGDRPRNAHHWMVISNELFDHREALMRDCLRRRGLADHLIERFLAFEESFRADIVKSEPWKKIVAGVELPVDGFGEIELASGSLCDGCGAEVAAGVSVRYHLRLGTLYCPACMDGSSPRAAIGGDRGRRP